MEGLFFLLKTFNSQVKDIFQFYSFHPILLIAPFIFQGQILRYLALAAFAKPWFMALCSCKHGT